MIAPDVPARPRAADADALLVPAPVHRGRVRRARSGGRRLLALEPVADPVCDRPARPHSPRCRCPCSSRPRPGSIPRPAFFNARHFASALSEEVARAGRFERPLSPIMADLDLLRDINNTYGHRGDAVLKGIADVFRGSPPLRRPRPVRRREFSTPPAETPTEQGARDRRADPPRRRREALRGRDLQRADSRHDLDGRGRLPGTPSTRTPSSTRPTSSTGRSSRGATVCSVRAPRRC